MKREKIEREAALDHVAGVIRQILNDPEFLNQGICHPVSHLLTTREMERLEVRLSKVILPLIKKISEV